jgi:hypothetical protein
MPHMVNLTLFCLTSSAEEYTHCRTGIHSMLRRVLLNGPNKHCVHRKICEPQRFERLPDALLSLVAHANFFALLSGLVAVLRAPVWLAHLLLARRLPCLSPGWLQ